MTRNSVEQSMRCHVSLPIVLCAALTSLAGNAAAEIKALSRANCIGFINESVTYERPQFRNFQGPAVTRHVPLGNIEPKHAFGAPNNGLYSWRFYAGDGSDPERMVVHGYHTWVLGGRVFTQPMSAVDCQLSEW
jgi:hypothetical protein